MTRIIRLAILVFAAMVAVYASGQDSAAQNQPAAQQQPASGRGTQQPEPQAPRPAPPQGKDAAFTVSGCLKSATTPGGFMLTNAWPVTEPDGGRQSLPTNETTAATAGATYVLISTAGDDLAKYLNQRVEVRGMLGPAPDAPTSAAPRSSNAQSLVSAAGSITVQTLKMVSGSCS